MRFINGVRQLSREGAATINGGGATYNRTPKTPGCRCVALVVHQLYSSHHDFDHACPLKALVAECLLLRRPIALLHCQVINLLRTLGKFHFITNISFEEQLLSISVFPDVWQACVDRFIS